jgi:diacylglycerol kinase (ATP)
MWHIIANPAAAGGAVERQWPRIEQLLQELGFDYSVAFTTHRGHAMRLVDDAILRGARRILGIGGDGTNHEIVNGIMQQRHVAPGEIRYALLPVGTGNDWARLYNLSRDPRQRLEALRAERTVWQDVGHVRYRTADGEVQERYFANVAGLAYDAFIVRALEGRTGIGRLQYLLMIGRYLFKYRLLPARIEYDDRVVDGKFYTINIGIGRYSGGGMQFVPQAVPDDGLFGLTFARRLPKLRVVLLTPHFYDGTILRRHARIEGCQAKSIRVVPAVGAAPTLLEADGEFLGETPAEFSIFARALQVVL